MKPTTGQLNFLDWECGMFFHFGIRSFFPGHHDWDGIEMSAEAFDPKELDCDEWMRAAKLIGAKYAILTTKHHDGFALWPSKFSRYCVANTPWQNGGGDVVREFTEACRRHGLKVGLYYSPAQWGSTAIKFENGKEYDDYFINQISELLTNYGKIDYLWFDGCGSEGHIYDRERIVREIFRLQPDILTFCDPEWTPCVRWVGNEDGYASLDNPLVVSKTDYSELAKEEQILSKAAFLPSECDCKLRATWFYDLNEDTIKTADELFGMYEMSVGHGSNFLLNVGPDSRGKIHEADMARLEEFSRKLAAYQKPIDHYSFETISEREYALLPKDPSLRGCLANRLAICEDLTEGQKVTSFRVWAYLPTYRKKRILLFEGKTVGHKVICHFGAIRASKYLVEVTACDGTPKICDMKAYLV